MVGLTALRINLKYKLLRRYKRDFEKLPDVRIFELNNFRRSNYWLQTLILNNNLMKVELENFFSKNNYTITYEEITEL